MIELQQMGRRYSDIRRGGELKTALDNKTAWDLNTNNARKTKRLTGGTGTKRDQKTVTIIPFSIKPATTAAVKYLVKIQGKSFTTSGGSAFGKAKADNYYDSTGITNAEKPPSGFSAARMTTFQSTATGTTINYIQAKATKLYYPERKGDRFHYPIGRLTSSPDSGDEKDVKRAILADLLTELNAQTGRTITFKDEKAGGTT